MSSQNGPRPNSQHHIKNIGHQSQMNVPPSMVPQQHQMVPPDMSHQMNNNQIPPHLNLNNAQNANIQPPQQSPIRSMGGPSQRRESTAIMPGGGSVPPTPIMAHPNNGANSNQSLQQNQQPNQQRISMQHMTPQQWAAAQGTVTGFPNPNGGMVNTNTMTAAAASAMMGRPGVMMSQQQMNSLRQIHNTYGELQSNISRQLENQPKTSSQRTPQMGLTQNAQTSMNLNDSDNKTEGNSNNNGNESNTNSSIGDPNSVNGNNNMNNVKMMSQHNSQQKGFMQQQRPVSQQQFMNQQQQFPMQQQQQFMQNNQFAQPGVPAQARPQPQSQTPSGHSQQQGPIQQQQPIMNSVPPQGPQAGNQHSMNVPHSQGSISQQSQQITPQQTPMGTPQHQIPLRQQSVSHRQFQNDPGLYSDLNAATNDIKKNIANIAIVRFHEFTEKVGMIGDTKSLDYWKKVIEEFFSESASVALTIRNGTDSRVYNFTYSLIGRVLFAIFESGASLFEVTPTGMKANVLPNGSTLIDIPRLSVRHWYGDGSYASLHGIGKCHFNRRLKFEKMEVSFHKTSSGIDCNSIDRFLSSLESADLRNNSTIKAKFEAFKCFNLFGLQESVLRIMQVSDVMTLVKPLMHYHLNSNSVSPIASLEVFNKSTLKDLMNLETLNAHYQQNQQHQRQLTAQQHFQFARQQLSQQQRQHMSTNIQPTLVMRNPVASHPGSKNSSPIVANGPSSANGTMNPNMNMNMKMNPNVNMNMNMNMGMSPNMNMNGNMGMAPNIGMNPNMNMGMPHNSNSNPNMMMGTTPNSAQMMQQQQQQMKRKDANVKNNLDLNNSTLRKRRRMNSISSSSGTTPTSNSGLGINSTGGEKSNNGVGSVNMANGLNLNGISMSMNNSENNSSNGLNDPISPRTVDSNK